MKKFISILLVVVMTFTMFAVSASAAKAPTIMATASSTQVKVGDTVTVTVSTSKNSKLCAATFSLLYDEEYFKVVDATSAGTFPSEIINDELPGEVKFVGATVSNISDISTTLFVVEFKVLKADGVITFDASEVYVVDGEKEVNVSDNYSPVGIIISAPFECDHNCHKGGIAGFFWKIGNFFNKIFRTKQYCECGAAHY